MNYSFLLGSIRSPEHMARLTDTAQELDSSKFSCTFSVVNNMAIFDTSPYDEAAWESFEDFRVYAAEHIIHKLSKRLA